LAAIRWVAANIEAFGGDPANMTLMGNSAGAMDASWLLASGRLPTGIRRLVLSSGVASAAGLGRGDAGSAHDPAEGRRRAASFLVALGFKTYEDLWSASTDEILARQAALIPPAEGLPEGDRLFYACTGSFSPRDPFDAAAAGMARGLDVMIGFTAFEMGLWLLWDEMFDARSPEWAARTQLPHVPDSLRDALPDLYRRWLPDESEGRLAMHMVGDAVFAMPAIFLADLLSRNGANVFLYRFDWQVDARFGAAHAFDLPFLFGLQGTASAEQLIGPARDAKDRDARKVLSDMFGKALHGFATNGRPEIAGQKWQRYETDRRMTALLDATPRQVPDPLADRRSWWTSHVLPRALGGGRD
jgi:para-nitrobenzyl esterase